MSDETVTKDLVGSRELKMAAELLTAYRSDRDETELLTGDGLAVWMNMESGYVFLCDADYNTAVMSDGILEDFITCVYCEHEGVRSEVADDGHRFDQWGAIVCREDSSAWAELLETDGDAE